MDKLKTQTVSSSSMNQTKKLIERRHAVVPRGVGIFAGETSAASASGSYLVDCDGRRMIDFAGGIGVMNAGHCDDTVVAAISRQAGKLLHACIHVATYEPYVALCEKLAALLPHGGATKVMLTNSGAEAVENAVKIARQATRRPAIISFEGAFHGRTLLGMTLTSKSGYKTNCGPFAPEVYYLPFPNYYRNGGRRSPDDYVKFELDCVRERFITGPVPAGHVAAILIEVVQGEGGFVPAPPKYLQGLREICDEHGILLICDEVQSGFCRTGRWAAYEHAGIVPDMSVWAKSMGGGLPIGAVVGRADVMDAAEPGTIGGTYSGNPVACAGALATIEVMERRNLNARALEIGERVKAAFDRLHARHPHVGEVRGLGAMVGIEFCYDGDPSRPAKDLVARVTEKCRADGLLILTAGPFANVIRVLAPLVIEDADLDRGLETLEAAVATAHKEQS